MNDYKGMTSDESIAYLRARLTEDEGMGSVTFTRLDGETVTVHNARFDTVSPVGANKGTIAVETDDEREIVHVPFVASWTVTPYL